MFDHLVAQWGYLAVAIGAFIEGEAAVVAAGALAHRGLLSLPLVMLSAFLGSVIGDQVWFQLGRRHGRPFIDRRPAWKERVDVVKARLDRFGTAFVFGFRFIIGLRTVTPALLGITGYPPWRFAVLNVVGAAVWSVVIGLVGWTFGAALASLLERVPHVEELLLAVVVCAVVVALVWRHQHKRVTPPVLVSEPPLE
ncbi:MAG TPA: DedA family protein [Myxococcota bacterium]